MDDRILIDIATTGGPATVRVAEYDEGAPCSCLQLFDDNYIGAGVNPIVDGFDSRLRAHLAAEGLATPAGKLYVELGLLIETGKSWQLGLTLVNLALATGRLVTDEAEATRLIWTTGEIGTSTWSTRPVECVPTKLQKSAERFRALMARGIAVEILVPEEQLEEARAEVPEGALLRPVGALAPLIAEFRPVIAAASRPEPAEPEVAPLPVAPAAAASPAPRRSHGRIAALAALALAAGGAGIWLATAPVPEPKPDPLPRLVGIDEGTGGDTGTGTGGAGEPLRPPALAAPDLPEPAVPTAAPASIRAAGPDLGARRASYADGVMVDHWASRLPPARGVRRIVFRRAAPPRPRLWIGAPAGLTAAPPPARADRPLPRLEAVAHGAALAAPAPHAVPKAIDTALPARLAPAPLTVWLAAAGGPAPAAPAAGLPPLPPGPDPAVHGAAPDAPDAQAVPAAAPRPAADPAPASRAGPAIPALAGADAPPVRLAALALPPDPARRGGAPASLAAAAMPQAVAAEASLSVPPPEGPDVSQLPLTAMRLRPGGGFDCSWFAMSGQQPLPEALALEAASTEIPADPRLCGLHVALRRGSLLELEARLDPPDSPGLRLALRRDGSPDPVTLWIDHARLTAPARLELVLHGTGEGAVRLSFALLPEGAAGSAGTGRQPLPAPGPAPQPETPTDPWAQIRQNPAPRLPQGGFPEGWNDLRR